MANQGMQRTTVVGVFSNRRDAETAVDDLKSTGFRDDQIGLLTREETNPDAGTTEDAGGSKAGEGAATGAVVGGLIGAAASLLIPGIGPVIAGGILATVLGSAVVGAAAGGILGGLVGLGIPEEEAQYYEGEFKAGRTLVTVKADGRYDEAQAILRRDGAYDVHDQAGASAGAGRPMNTVQDRERVGTSGMSGATSSAPMRETGSAAPASGTMGGAAARSMGVNQPTTREAARTTGETRIPITEEQIIPQKRSEEVGEVDIRRHVVEEQRSTNVPVSREEVHVERRPADRPLAPGEQAFTEDTLRIPIVEEKVTVIKQPRVVGEVVINKEKTVEQQEVSATVRREDVNVERTGEQSRSTQTRRWSDIMPTYRSNWQQRYGSRGGTWEDAAPAYEYGYNAYQSPTYQGKDWATVEPNLRSDWERRYPTTPWERIRMYVMDIWSGNRQTA